MAMFHMANDSGLFRTREQLEQDHWSLTGNLFTREKVRMLPLYEAKMLHHFDSRFATYMGATQAQINKGTLPRLTSEQHDDPDFVVQPRYWIQEFDTLDKKASKSGRSAYSAVGITTRLKSKHWDRGWLLGWRDICRGTDERTLISTVMPRSAVGDKYLLAFTERRGHLLMANMSSFIVDYCARQKVSGSSLKYYLIKQFPILPPDSYDVLLPWLENCNLGRWIEQRVLELSYTSWDMAPFAQDLGDDGPPFRWNEGRRALIRAELDAAYFHLYGLGQDEVEHVMESFGALRRREEKPQNLGEFRTKRLILERFVAISEAIRTGEPYQTILDPPPGHGPRHPARTHAATEGHDHA